MSGSKKHPLEIFRSSDQRLGKGALPDGPEGDVPAASDRAAAEEPTRREEMTRPAPVEPPVAVAAPHADEFEIRLKLPGALVVLFAFVVGMAAAHMYGHHRGAAAVRGEVDARAAALGREIESASSSDADEGGVSAATAAPWYGVVAITYSSNQSRLLESTMTVLEDRYDLGDFYRWEFGDKVELYIGASQDRRDPTLLDYARRLRLIDDFPTQPSDPFRDAMIKRHPLDPTDPNNLAGG